MKRADLIAPMWAAYQHGDLALGQRFKVHTVDRGTNQQIQRQAQNLRTNLLKYLDGHYELGLFSVSALPSPEYHGGYDIFVTYYGEAKNVRAKAKWKAQRRSKNPASQTAGR